MNQDRYLQLVSGFARAHILVLGDVMLDRFVYGKTERISPEAPVPVLLQSHEAVMPGGAANVARNIASLGGKATLIGAVGEDAAGAELAGALAQLEIGTAFVVTAGRPTSVKTRFVADHQQIVRVDQEFKGELGEHAATLLEQFATRLPGADVIVLSDYSKGVLSDRVVRQAIALARQAGKPVVVDPKSADIARYDGATLLTPNLCEAAAATGLAGTDDGSVRAMAEALLAVAPQLSSVIVTRSADGMSLAERGKPVRHLPVVAREVFDVSGAGDTVVATLSVALAAGADLAEAAELANLAAAIVVGKLGTAEVWTDELAEAVQKERLHDMVGKITTEHEALEMVRRWKKQGLKIGFTNGCFDLIHPGHISLLQQARAQCDRLVVGLNTDASVKRLKGLARPLQDEQARAIVLGALAMVDLVVLFNQDTPEELIEKVRPDVLIKGADYALDQVVGADFVQSYGGRVYLARLAEGRSTTNIVSRMNKQTA
jgi:D-beta-D-heptose 7-phosphate kinase/D-beta-D-heptose 1-phosphate adenosyltransferase